MCYFLSLYFEVFNYKHAWFFVTENVTVIFNFEKTQYRIALQSFTC